MPRGMSDDKYFGVGGFSHASDDLWRSLSHANNFRGGIRFRGTGDTGNEMKGSLSAHSRTSTSASVASLARR